MSPLTLLLTVVVVACVAPHATCRPQNQQNDDDANFIWRPQDSEPTQNLAGSIVGELFIFSDSIAVKPSGPKPPSGPQTSALRSGPGEGSVSVGSGTGVAVAETPALTISGSTVTFNQAARVLPIDP